MNARNLPRNTVGSIAFNPASKEHRAIVVGAMAAADSLGQGRITAAREMLELNDICVTHSELSRYVLAWGEGL